MLRRLLLTAAASVAALSAAPAVAQADLGPLPMPLPMPVTESTPDRLTVEVTDAGHGRNGTFELECHPPGGTHPQAQEACTKLDQGTWGTDTFAATPAGANCTMQYGGPATAHVTGTWNGRPVDATYNRGNGCEISRWDRLVPVLPDVNG